MNCFLHENKKNFFRSNLRFKNMKIYMEDISLGLDSIKISFLNEVNSLTLPSFVSYVPSSVLRSDNLSEEFESIAFPCDCRNICPEDCKCSVYTKAYSNGRLSATYSHNKEKPIVECSPLCKCESQCTNRLVQHGIQFSLQVFMTESKGFGVRTKEFIPKYAFVCEYAGEIIDAKEAQQRMQYKTFDEANFIYVLKEYNSEHAYTQTIIDPTYIGNVGRYINHSCSPNLISVPVRTNSMIPKICFFASVDILPEEELTYNYGGDMSHNSDTKSQESKINFARRCLCKTSNCTGFLPFSYDNWLS